MLLCSYENRTGETLDPKKLEYSKIKLADLLTGEDFKTTHSVSNFIKSLPILFDPYFIQIFYSTLVNLYQVALVYQKFLFPAAATHVFRPVNMAATGLPVLLRSIFYMHLWNFITILDV